MKAEEQTAEAWLCANYHDIQIEFEPDGSIPPDFLLGGSVAIEVRRLNETRIDPVNGRPVGHNEDDNRLWGFLEKAFRRLPLNGSVQYLVHASLTDPAWMPLGKATAKDIRNAYQQLNGAAGVTDHQGFQLEWTIWNASTVTDPVILGGMDNQNSGGRMEQVYIDNLARLIAEKTSKVTANSAQVYENWWLVLVDYIFPGSRFSHKFNVGHIDKGVFERIVMIDRDGGLLHEW